MRVTKQGGFTLVELTVTIVIISIVVVSFFGLFVSLVNSTVIARRRDAALVLATNQMENLKSQSYDSLVVQSPTTVVQRVNGVNYNVKTIIRYVDDAYDGCGSYPSQAEKLLYCRNSVASTPTTDLNDNDYKIIHVSVTDETGKTLASVDTEVASNVAETATTTGALFVHVVDGTGAPIAGATVAVSNTTLVPVVNRSDNTDSNGTDIFYALTPDSGTDYVITASKAGYSTLVTKSSSGSLQPVYASQKIVTQQSSSVTLTLVPMSTSSLLVEATNTSGTPLAGMNIYAKGGYKNYTATADTSYYYDNTAACTTPASKVTDSSGLCAITGLAPINGYIFCGDLGDTGCKIGSTTYYLAAALPYGGVNSLGPITIPTYSASNPPTTTYAYGSPSVGYMQEVRLMFSTSETSPRVFAMNPYQLSLASATLNPFLINITGVNLGSASAKLVQGGNTYTGTSCTTSSTQLKCSYDLTGITSGPAQLVVSNSSGTLTLPTTPLGGFNVNP